MTLRIHVDRSDAIMLSGETAVGDCSEAVSTMYNIQLQWKEFSHIEIVWICPIASSKRQQNYVITISETCLNMEDVKQL